MGIRSAVVVCLALTACDMPTRVSLAELRASGTVSLDSRRVCTTRSGICFPIIDRDELITVVTLRVDFGDADAELAELPRASLDGVAGSPEPSTPGAQQWRWRGSISDGADFEIADATDAWWISLSGVVERTVTLVEPLGGDDEQRPSYSEGDEVVAEVVPAPPPEAIVEVFGGFLTTRWAETRVEIDLDDGLLYDAGRGELAGDMGALPDGIDGAFGELTIGLRVARAIDCDGPAVCDIEASDGFEVERMVDLVR